MKTLCSKICIALLLLTSIGCSEKEIQHDETQFEQIRLPIVSEKVNFERIPHYNRIVERLNKLHEKFNNKSALARDGDDEMLSIITEDVLYTQYDSTHTYTFKILREQPQAYVENLVFHYNLDADDYDEYLVQYHVNAQAFLELSTNGLLQSSKQVTMTTLDQGFFDGNLVNRDCERVCETIYVTCEWDFHDESNIGDWTNCNSYGTSGGPSTYQSCSTTCDDSGGEDETIDDGDSGGGGKGDVITNPNTNEPCDTVNGGIGISGDTGECFDVFIHVLDENNPSCDSFNFSQVGTTSWQCAAVSGVQETFSVFSWTELAYYEVTGIFVQPLYFQMPGTMTSTWAAERSADALREAFIRFDVYYDRHYNDGYAALEIVLREFIVEEMQEYGGTMTLTPPLGFDGEVSAYETTIWGNGNCD
ncbi:hypothetical protein [uncultured Psychroserpens sp.]|uniref:hypothetical protein n=1 Tax=uncultured Psychroserpens sp. TaxID=255436 RepID=UPI00260C71AD|nr:hypothetical protein [uncultured Psychroserpens sp.]